MSNQSNEQENRAMEFLNASPIHKQALTSCMVCGLTTLPFLEYLTVQAGMQTSGATVRRVLKSLSRAAAGYPALLVEYSIKIEGRSGAGLSVYVPTPFSRELLRGLGIQLPEVNTPALRGHRYIQLEVYLHSLQSGAEVEVEKVIPYDNKRRNIRVDVLATYTRELELPGHIEEDQYFFEAEQELLQSNAKRAFEKMRNWQDYGLPGEYPNIVIVFNVPRKKLERTIALWRDALQILNEEPTFQISYILLNDLLDLPLRDAVKEYGVNLDPDVNEPDEEREEYPLSPFVRQLRTYQPDPHLLENFEVALDDMQLMPLPAGRVDAFFALMRSIHQASDLRENGDIYQYSLLPVGSLYFLHHYLTLPENQNLYMELRTAIQWMQSRGNLGVTLLKEISAQILWDVFLAHHGFARGGRLQVNYLIADPLDPKKSFGVRVVYHKDRPGSMEQHPDDAALEWVLNALFTYSDLLGLGRLPWRKKAKVG